MAIVVLGGLGGLLVVLGDGREKRTTLTAAVSTTMQGTFATPAPTAPPVTEVEALIRQLVVAPESGAGGFDSGSFDQGDGGTDSRGCTTRARVLMRDSTTRALVDDPGCIVRSGSWRDAYTGDPHNDPRNVSVDHLVAPAEAWRSGAHAWDPAKRRAFANDLAPGALVVVSGSGNASKADKDPAKWQPSDPTLARKYVESWLRVKVRYGLTSDQAEVDALRERLLGRTTCAATGAAGCSGPRPTGTTRAPDGVVTPTTRPATTVPSTAVPPTTG